MEIKRNMRHLKGIEDYGLWYKKGGKFELKVFTDVGWVGNVDDRKNTSGGELFLEKRLVSWKERNIITSLSLQHKKNMFL